VIGFIDYVSRFIVYVRVCILRARVYRLCKRTYRVCERILLEAERLSPFIRVTPAVNVILFQLLIRHFSMNHPF
jgi:hypothetical protein